MRDRGLGRRRHRVVVNSRGSGRPKNKNLVLCQSTRVACVGVFGAQCSYDLRFIRKVVGGRAYEHPALWQLLG